MTSALETEVLLEAWGAVNDEEGLATTVTFTTYSILSRTACLPLTRNL